MNVGFQGAPGAFSEEAIVLHFEAAEAIGFESFESLLDAVALGDVDAALLPCENSIHGSIARNYDLLAAHPTLRIVDETTHRIVQYLIGTPDATLESLAVIRSHPVALEQCRVFLRSVPNARIEAVFDTAGAVREVVALGDPSVGAIGPVGCAERYGGRLLASAIQDEAENFTRFFEVRRGAGAPVVTGRACLSFTLPHRPGSLYDALGLITEAGANLRSLVTRPLVGRPFEYRFYVEIEKIGAAEVAKLASAIDPEAQILGIYGS